MQLHGDLKNVGVVICVLILFPSLSLAPAETVEHDKQRLTTVNIIRGISHPNSC